MDFPMDFPHIWSFAHDFHPTFAQAQPPEVQHTEYGEPFIGNTGSGEVPGVGACGCPSALQGVGVLVVDIDIRYPLVNVNKKLWKITMFNG